MCHLKQEDALQSIIYSEKYTHLRRQQNIIDGSCMIRALYFI